MRVSVTCGCCHVFAVEDDRVGGFVNCPRCGKAVRVEGLHDPLWVALQLGATFVSLLVAVFVGREAGWWVGVAAGGGLLGLLWLLSRAL